MRDAGRVPLSYRTIVILNNQYVSRRGAEGAEYQNIPLPLRERRGYEALATMWPRRSW